MTMTTQDFITAHRHDDTRRLALKYQGTEGVDLPYALDQISGWQTARRKLPSWAATDGIIYPPHISMEQCSSEATARYKADVAARFACEYGKQPQATTLTDLTGGFGVDFSFMAQKFGHATYVERNARLCDIVRKNLASLSISNANIECTDAINHLESMERTDVIFIDPARRDNHGGRTYAISDCTPDILEIMERLLNKTDTLMVKLSPMLDIAQAVSDIEHGNMARVIETHVVAVANECKELLFVIRRQKGYGATPARKTYCVNDGKIFVTAEDDENSGETPVSDIRDIIGIPGRTASANEDDSRHAFLYVPHAAIMKAGCFSEVSRRFGMRQPDPNSHLFVSDNAVAGFPGRQFTIRTVTSMNKKELRRALATTDRANVAVRNFPMTADELRRRLRLKDGGDTYIFGTTVCGNRLLLICAKDQQADMTTDTHGAKTIL